MSKASPVKCYLHSTLIKYKVIFSMLYETFIETNLHSTLIKYKVKEYRPSQDYFKVNLHSTLIKYKVTFFARYSFGICTIYIPL